MTNGDLSNLHKDKQLGRLHDMPQWLRRSFSSNIATVAAVTLFYPLEIIKTRSQV